MKKSIIGALVGGLILFMWQFLSWSMLNVHKSEMAHTANQDAILEVLSKNLEEGSYFLPNLPETAASSEHADFMEKSIGKPWAQISYHESMEMSMGMNMFRGAIVNFLAVFLLCWLLIGHSDLNFKRVFVSSLFVGLIGYMTITYIESIWFEVNSIPYLIDTVVQWGICGLWLGWWLNRD